MKNGETEVYQTTSTVMETKHLELGFELGVIVGHSILLAISSIWKFKLNNFVEIIIMLHRNHRNNIKNNIISFHVYFHDLYIIIYYISQKLYNS